MGKSHYSLLHNYSFSPSLLHPLPISLSCLHRIIDKVPHPLHTHCVVPASTAVNQSVPFFCVAASPVALHLLYFTSSFSYTSSLVWLSSPLPSEVTVTSCVCCLFPSLPHVSSLPTCLVSHPEAVSVHVHNSLHIPPALMFTGPVVNPALPGHQPSTGTSHQSPLPLAACPRDAKSIACLGLDVLLLWPTIA
ncbi:hypothetical protein F5Y03DRAFT_311774 [Xylaria venustula]|nr:hypothetical protein F5Y03DRAFT_311774 [Xylaria venustula]